MYKDTSQQYNTMRSVKFATYGAGVAPFINIWFRFLNTRFPMPNGGPTYFPQLLKRVAADQLVWAPLGVAVFFGGMGIMDAYSKNLSVMLEVREKFTLYWQVLKTNVGQCHQSISLLTLPFSTWYFLPFNSSHSASFLCLLGHPLLDSLVCCGSSIFPSSMQKRQRVANHRHRLYIID